MLNRILLGMAYVQQHHDWIVNHYVVKHVGVGMHQKMASVMKIAIQRHAIMMVGIVHRQRRQRRGGRRGEKGLPVTNYGGNVY
jgi:hypothetical protein